MAVFKEGKLECTFPDSWDVTKYDGWAFYRNQFGSSCCGCKAVDFLAFNPEDRTLWLIELKDYRQFPRTKDDVIDLWDEVAIKARDTLAGVFAAKVYTAHPEHTYAASVLRATPLCVVLHLEQPRTHSKLYPRTFDRAVVQQKLKQLFRPIDAHPRVVELADMAGVPWNATSQP